MKKIWVFITGLVLGAGIALGSLLADLPLMMKGVKQATAQWTPPALDFGEVQQGSFRDLNSILKNVGNGTLTGTIIVQPSCAANYSILSGGGTFSLDRNQTRTVTIRGSVGTQPGDTLSYPCKIQIIP